MSEKLEYGLLIETTQSFGTTYVRARAMARVVGQDYPRNPSYLDTDVPLDLDGLGLHGHLYTSSDGEVSVIGTEPSYQDRFKIDLQEAKRMAKTLAKVAAQAEKDASVGVVDQFHSLAKAIKATFVVKRIGKGQPASSYADNRWNFMTIPEGKRAFAYMIEEAITAEKEKRKGRVA